MAGLQDYGSPALVYENSQSMAIITTFLLVSIAMAFWKTYHHNAHSYNICIIMHIWSFLDFKKFVTDLKYPNNYSFLMLDGSHIRFTLEIEYREIAITSLAYVYSNI